ncbi:hypothetical protein CMUS01_02040 [Colletotrichum musicola]|uniref:Uncharacterized protein n=1 Tax=Colletotrichum musicola TaxID=2175873 RepID=A0A8H6NVS6_9PEZI|nr:hypothetical protein CMUS01_02040 [Colletotrichum musicola]
MRQTTASAPSTVNEERDANAEFLLRTVQLPTALARLSVLPWRIVPVDIKAAKPIPPGTAGWIPDLPAASRAGCSFLPRSKPLPEKNFRLFDRKPPILVDIAHSAGVNDKYGFGNRPSTLGFGPQAGVTIFFWSDCSCSSVVSLSKFIPVIRRLSGPDPV